MASRGSRLEPVYGKGEPAAARRSWAARAPGRGTGGRLPGRSRLLKLTVCPLTFPASSPTGTRAWQSCGAAALVLPFHPGRWPLLPPTHARVGAAVRHREKPPPGMELTESSKPSVLFSSKPMSCRIWKARKWPVWKCFDCWPWKSGEDLAWRCGLSGDRSVLPRDDEVACGVSSLLSSCLHAVGFGQKGKLLARGVKP